jgi:transcription-repair coupling factor (superfamily II helicase)
MFISDLNAIYSRSQAVQTIASHLTSGANSKIHMRGTVGSGSALVAYATVIQPAGVHLFILHDKEEAAYLLNDLESAAGKLPGEEMTTSQHSIQHYFFPRSAKQAY